MTDPATDLRRQVRELRGAVRRLEYLHLDLDARIDAEDAREKVLRARLAAVTAANGRLAETLGAFRHRVVARLAGLLRRP